MIYAIGIERRAVKAFGMLAELDYQRIKKALTSLADDPRPHGCKKLTGREGWRIRVGDYRVIYLIDDAERTVTVLHIGPRGSIY